MLQVARADRPRMYWEAIRDQEVRRAALEAEVELRQLDGQNKILQARKVDVEAELKSLGKTESELRAHRILGRWWGLWFLAAVVVAMLSAWWSLKWYLSLTWEKALLALAICALPIAGWMAFLMITRDRMHSRNRWRIICTLGLIIILCSIVATTLLGAGRMAGTSVEEEQRQAVESQAQTELGSTSNPSSSEGRVSRTKMLLGVFGMISAICLGIAGDIAAGLAFDECLKHLTIVRTVEPLYKEQRLLGERLVENERRREEVRLSPEMLYVRLTAEALRKEEAAERQALEAEQRDSLWPLIKWICLVTGLGLLLLVAIAALALANEGTVQAMVVVLDLTNSSQAEQEFAKNLQAVEALAQLVPAGGTRLVVLGITEASFGRSPLLVTISPRYAGKFGEYLEGWRRKVAVNWRKVAGTLQPTARGSDLLGAIARAAIEFEGEAGRKRLIILSDMREAARTRNFERTIPDLSKALSQVERQGLLVRLEGVETWILGAHTIGLDEGHWAKLKAFWTEYFKRTGAELKAFRPDRRCCEG